MKQIKLPVLLNGTIKKVKAASDSAALGGAIE